MQFYVIRGKWNQNHTISSVASVEDVPRKSYVLGLSIGDELQRLSDALTILGVFDFSVHVPSTPTEPVVIGGVPESSGSLFWDRSEGRAVIVIVCLCLIILIIILVIILVRRRRKKKKPP